MTKRWDLSVVVPVPDMANLPTPNSGGDDTSDWSASSTNPSIWPHVEARVAEVIGQHRSTIVFANSRRQTERLTQRLNETVGSQPGDRADDSGPEQSEAVGEARVIARAHHGSVSKEQRREIEEALKQGQLTAVVATSSLELGIDMGAVDVVVQVESPPSVASGLQRVGRAGHQVGAVSRGVLFPKFRGDLVQTAVAPTAVCFPCSWSESATRASVSSTRRWSTSRAWGTSSLSARTPGGLRTSATTASS
ncbi:MAG: hypothetical protein EB027_01650 [Actinobacteria bacterium]|nr:hypothetical protein [Actinomycetota bacterium]